MPDAIPVPPDAVTAASGVLWGIEGTTPPYTARVAEYVAIDSTGPERDAEMAEFRAADAEAQRLNDGLVRRALEAAASLIAAAERTRILALLDAWRCSCGADDCAAYDTRDQIASLIGDAR